MEQRKQFTFYRSFWDALQDLPREDRLPVLEAIISYALDGEELQGLQYNQASFFKLCKPNLDAARKKAAAGKKGGSKLKANQKQTESKKEKENEKENENEIENEYECIKDRDFESFWEIYPRKVGKQKAREVYLQLQEEPEVILAAVRRQRACAQWQRQNGQFIPNPATWLQERRWEDGVESAPSTPARVPDAEEIAAVRRLLEHG